MNRLTCLLLLALTCVGCAPARTASLRFEPGRVKPAAVGPDSMLLPEFEIDRTLVTQGAYEQCVRKGACEAPSPRVRLSRPELPMTHVTWEQADQYCAWQGKRLPTSAELERMREVNSQALETGGHEWVDDWYTYYGRDFLPLSTHEGLIANTRLVRGERYYGRVPSDTDPQVGFRCSRWLSTLASK